VSTARGSQACASSSKASTTSLATCNDATPSTTTNSRVGVWLTLKAEQEWPYRRTLTLLIRSIMLSCLSNSFQWNPLSLFKLPMTTQARIRRGVVRLAHTRSQAAGWRYRWTLRPPLKREGTPSIFGSRESSIESTVQFTLKDLNNMRTYLTPNSVVEARITKSLGDT
jgi:hypothetical protein